MKLHQSTPTCKRLYLRAFRLAILLVFASVVFALPKNVNAQSTADTAKYRKGMVVCAMPQASQVGIDILKKGGNAVDAAVAVQFALEVTHPQAGNIGGGGFMVFRAANGATNTLDFRE